MSGFQDGFGMGTDNQPIWLDGLSCEGEERSIALCDHEGWGRQNCGHFEDVAVICPAPPGALTTPIPTTSTTGKINGSSHTTPHGRRFLLSFSVIVYLVTSISNHLPTRYQR